MKFTNILPDLKVKSLFLGKDEHLDEILDQEFAGYKVVRMIQVHSAEIAFLDEKAIEDFPDEVIFLDGVDGVFTNHPKTVLIVKAADCYPILLHHPQGVIGAVHAGRVGTEKQIVKKSLELAVAQTGYKEGWKLWLGPKICKDCYQINRETDEHYDLKAKNVAQIESTLDGENNFALDSELCTFHHEDWFYSYRREGEGVKMNFGLIGLVIGQE
ncbi:polyphenol oxidase family protein [Patescibacteria group bacterium]|nr:polyphenol oxidase family protein [Patescibacteria group bacterium]